MTLTLIDPKELARNALFQVLEIPIPKPRRMYAFNSMPTNEGYEFPSSPSVEKTKYKMLVREDTGEPISIMTDQYKLIQNEEVLNIVAKSVSKFGNIRISEANIFGNARTKITFDTDRVNSVNGDSLSTRFTMFNSYDGTAKISIRPSLLRLSCLNGAITSHEFEMIAYRHLNKLDVAETISKLISTSMQAIDDSVANEIKLMMETKINNPNNIARFLSFFPEKNGQVVLGEFAKNEKNYWSLLNAGTYVLTHVANRDSESTHKIESFIYLKVLQMAKGEN